MNPAGDDLAATIEGLKFKIYECSLNLGAVEAGKRKLESKQEEIVEQQKRLEELKAEETLKIREDTRHLDKQVQDKKRSFNRYKSLTKQLEALHAESDDLRIKLSTGQKLLESCIKKEQIREKRLEKVAHENAELEQRISDLTLQHHNAVAALSSASKQRDVDLSRLRLRYEEENNVLSSAKEEVFRLQSEIAQIDENFEKLRRNEYLKETETLQMLSDNTLTSVKSSFQTKARKMFDSMSQLSHHSNSMQETGRDVLRDSALGGDDQQGVSQGARPGALDSQVAALSGKLQGLESVVKWGLELHALEQSSDLAKKPSADNSIELMEIRMKMSQLENQLQQRQASDSMVHASSAKSVELKMQREMDTLTQDMNTKILLLESSLRKQFDGRISALEESVSACIKSNQLSQRDIETGAHRAVELEREVRDTREALEHLSRDTKAIRGVVDVADKRILDVEARGRSLAMHASQVDLALSQHEEEARCSAQDLAALKRSNTQVLDVVSKAVSEINDVTLERQKVKASLVALHNRLNRVAKTVVAYDSSKEAEIARLRMNSEQDSRAIEKLEMKYIQANDQISSIGLVVSQSLGSSSSTSQAGTAASPSAFSGPGSHFYRRSLVKPRHDVNELSDCRPSSGRQTASADNYFAPDSDGAMLRSAIVPSSPTPPAQQRASRLSSAAVVQPARQLNFSHTSDDAERWSDATADSVGGWGSSKPKLISGEGDHSGDRSPAGEPVVVEASQLQTPARKGPPLMPVEEESQESGSETEGGDEGTESEPIPALDLPELQTISDQIVNGSVTKSAARNLLKKYHKDNKRRKRALNRWRSHFRQDFGREPTSGDRSESIQSMLLQYIEASKILSKYKK